MWCNDYFWWGCRKNFKLMTLRSESVKHLTWSWKFFTLVQWQTANIGIQAWAQPIHMGIPSPPLPHPPFPTPGCWTFQGPPNPHSIQFIILHTFCVFSTLGDTSISLQDEVIFLQSPKPHKIWPLHIQGPTGVALCQELLLGCRLSPYNKLLLIICIILWTTTVIVNKLIWLVCGW